MDLFRTFTRKIFDKNLSALDVNAVSNLVASCICRAIFCACVCWSGFYIWFVASALSILGYVEKIFAVFLFLLNKPSLWWCETWWLLCTPVLTHIKGYQTVPFALQNMVANDVTKPKSKMRDYKITSLLWLWRTLRNSIVTILLKWGAKLFLNDTKVFTVGQ